MNDMTQMHQYVYDMYIQMAQSMNFAQAGGHEPLKKPPVADTSEKTAVQKEIPIEFESIKPESKTDEKKNADESDATEKES